MCGLVLVVNKNHYGFSKEQCEVFSTLLYMSGHFRGRDGTGVVVVDNLGNPSLAKANQTVDGFICTKEYDELDKKAFQKGWLMYGHNRAATRGVINDVNCHPFVIDDNIILVHNGTFHGDHTLLKKTDVDSEALAHTIATTDTVENALRKINAAYALMWYNVEQRTMNVIRNSSRPLWYMETSDSYIYASEEVFLTFVRDKFKLKIKTSPFEIKDSCLSTFKLDDDGSIDVDCIDLDISFHKYNVGGSVNHSPFPENSGNAWNENYVPWNQKHPYSCAWGDEYENTIIVPVDKKANEYAIVDTKSTSSTRRVLEALGKITSATLHSEWQKLLELYKGKNKIKVVVNDLVEADDTPKTNSFILIGRTCDEHNLQVVFPLKEKTFDQVMELSSDSLFEIDYSGLTWSRSNYIDVDTTKPLDEWPGVVLLHGINPQPVLMIANETSC